jgi:hypothetical protein
MPVVAISAQRQGRQLAVRTLATPGVTYLWTDFCCHVHESCPDEALVMLKTIIAASVVSTVILVEVIAAYLLIPGQEELQTWAKEQAKAGSKHGDGKSASSGEHGENDGDPEIEVDLGKFNIVVHKPAASYTMRINFHLIATVKAAEEGEFAHLLEKCQHRLRDQVIFEVRNAEIGDLTDPGLALIKRKILGKRNDLLGKPLLTTIVFSDYAFVEQ